MTIKQRRVFYLILTAIFLIISPFLIIYSLGYRFNQEQNKFQKTGALYIRSNPAGAEILLNGKNTNLTTPNKITSLLPGEYNIEVQKSKFLSWKKNLNVKSYSTTFSEDIYLYKSDLDPQLIKAGKVNSFLTSPSRKKIIYTINEDANLNCYLFYFSSFKSDLIDQMNQIDDFVEWSADEEKILFQDLNKNYSVIDLTNKNKIITLSQISNLRFDQIVWDEQGSSILWGLVKNKLYKINLLELSFEIISAPKIYNLLPAQEGHYFIYQKPNLKNLYLALAEYKKFDSFIEISELPFSNYYQIKKADNWLFVYNSNNQLLYFLKFNEQDPLLYNALKSIEGYSIMNNLLLFWNNYEYWVYDLEKQDAQLIERLSAKIYNVTWHPEANYLLVETKNHLKIIETDDRDKKNNYNILNPELIINEQITFDPDNKILVFVNKINNHDGLYYIQLQ